jgi:hypoxanthine phosphoribosyltransferase
VKSRGKLKGLQFISYAQLAADIFEWSKQFPQNYFSIIAGVPRSGLTVAHMLSVHLNAPATSIHGSEFRQSTGRKTISGNGPVLIVDDTASYGTAMREVRSQVVGTQAEFAAVYARPVSHKYLDYWYTEHKEPDWLVITEWNWYRHQDAEYIAVTDDVLAVGFEFNPKFDAVYSQSEAVEGYSRSMATVLFAIDDCQFIADHSGKPVVNAKTMQIHNPGQT